MNYISEYFFELIGILNEMSPYLMLGFFFAGLLHVFFPKDMISRFLGGRNIASVINAALLGIPLPLCSCGVIPTGISFYKNGASKGSTVSFLISTPQTGIDSIMVTYSLLGLPFALIRPVIALVTGFWGGFLSNITDKGVDTKTRDKVRLTEIKVKKQDNPVFRMFRYAFVEFLQDISKWLVIGLLIAAVISVLIPDDFFIKYIGNDYLDMLIMLVVSIPLYVCATASVPIAAVLILKGISPGAAIVFLMAGPATNAATIMLINNVLGRKTLFVYLLSIISGALFFGVLVNNFLPGDLFIIPAITEHAGGHSSHEILPLWLKSASSIALTLLIINGYIQKYLVKKRNIRSDDPDSIKTNLNIEDMKDITIIVKGMTCNHCKANVENSITSVQGVDEVKANPETSRVIIKGDNIDLGEIKNAVEKIGYKYEGQVK